jgi:hypothetical protein
LANLLPNPGSAQSRSATPGLSARGGAVQFAFATTDMQGCGAIVVSIWDDTKLIPLDGLVQPLQVGSQTKCDAIDTAQPNASSLYLSALKGLNPDVSLEVIEFTVTDTPHSTSFMTLRQPVDGCESYQWNNDDTLSRQVLNSTQFKNDLKDASGGGDTPFSVVADDLRQTLFPAEAAGTRCKATAAYNALKKLAQTEEVRLYARVSDDQGALTIVPLGLLSMYQENGKNVFPHDIRLFQPVAQQTLEDTHCVSLSDWTFMLTSPLGTLPVPPPSSLKDDPRLLETKDQFVDNFLNVSSDDPAGLVLLAHHLDGYLTFAAGKNLTSNQIKRKLGAGSIVILSACQTGNITGDTGLIRSLNVQGADAIVATAFELDTEFGTDFATNFSDLVAGIGSDPLTVEQAFESSLAKTVNDSGNPDKARGISLELVLAGNPALQICGKTSAVSGAHDSVAK